MWQLRLHAIRLPWLEHQVLPAFNPEAGCIVTCLSGERPSLVGLFSLIYKPHGKAGLNQNQA